MDSLSKEYWEWKWPGKKPDYMYHKPTFELHVGKEGHAFLVPAITVLANQADHIYVTAWPDWDKPGSGFAGSTLKLPLLNGDYFELKGGWHTRAAHLLEQTGIDVTNQFLTWGAVGEKRTGYMDLMGIHYADKVPTMGQFNRIETIAQAMANVLFKSVYYSVHSMGGGSSGPVHSQTEHLEGR